MCKCDHCRYHATLITAVDRKLVTSGPLGTPDNLARAAQLLYPASAIENSCLRAFSSILETTWCSCRRQEEAPRHNFLKGGIHLERSIIVRQEQNGSSSASASNHLYKSGQFAIGADSANSLGSHKPFVKHPHGEHNLRLCWMHSWASLETDSRRRLVEEFVPTGCVKKNHRSPRGEPNVGFCLRHRWELVSIHTEDREGVHGRWLKQIEAYHQANTCLPSRVKRIRVRVKHLVCLW